MAVRSRALLGVAALLFAACTTVTVVWGASMSAVGGMAMPGGWTLSMTWMRMPGRTWLGAAASFIAMWVIMMAAMMLPSLVPMLWRYREAVAAAGARRVGRLTALVGAGYFSVWTLFGMSAFPLGIALAGVAMRLPAAARAVPVAAGAIVLLAGALQLTGWKARQLECCRRMPEAGIGADAVSAWAHGLRLGRHCSFCCCGLTASLLAVGAMDLRAMALVTAAVNIERIAGERVARAIGVAIMGTGIVLIARAAGVD